MPMKKIFVFVSLLIAFTGCQTTNAPSLINQSDNHIISISDAMGYLYDYMGGGTKQHSNPKTVDQVFSLSHSLLTKSASEDTSGGIYIATFAEGGYAILSADDRVPEQVLSYSDRGSISQNELCLALEDSGRSTFSGYPISGSPFITDDNYPGELFINPNTFNWYNNSINDYYVGNMCIQTPTDTISFSPAVFKIVASMGYVSEQIMAWEGDHSFSEPQEMRIKTYYRTKARPDTTSRLLLDSLHTWHQNSPFNDECPMVRRYILFGPKEKAPCGCLPLSLAKVLTKFRYPSSFTINGFQIDWETLNEDYNMAATSASKLLYQIGVLSNTLYFAEGAFTFPISIKNTMETLGFHNVTIANYSTEQIINQIDNDLPAIVCSVPSTNDTQFSLINSHAWNIDGYRIRTVQKHTEIYLDNELIEHNIEDVRQSYEVYCDFGWGGNDNGYLVSGAFVVGDVNYNHWYLKTISYER